MDRTTTSARQARYFINFSRQDTNEEPQKGMKASSIFKILSKRPSWLKQLEKRIKAKLRNVCPPKDSRHVQVDFDEAVGTQESLPPPPNIKSQSPASPQKPHKSSDFLTVPACRRTKTRRLRTPMYNPLVHENEIIIPTTKSSVEVDAKDAKVPPIFITHEDMNKGYMIAAPNMHGKSQGCPYHGAEVVDGVTVYFDAPKHRYVGSDVPKTAKEVSGK
jgi:hypothetical protein